VLFLFDPTLVGAFKGLSGPEMVGALAAIVVVMGGFVAMVAILATVSAASALPLLALGAAFLMIGGGIAIAALGIGFMVKSFGEIPYDNLTALPGAMLGIGAGLYMMASAGMIAMPVILALIALAAVAPGLASLGIAMGGLLGGGDKEEKPKEEPKEENKDMELLVKKIDDLIKALAIPGKVMMDAKSVGEALRLNGVYTAGVR